MGLFSDEKIVNVASTVYNMAGEEKDRPQFLQSLMMRNILSHTTDSIGDTIRTGYLNGPAIRLRQFFRWARKDKNYGAVGMPTGVIESGNEIDPSTLQAYIPHPAGTEVWAQHAEVGNANYTYWAEEWVMKNRPAELDKAWVSTYSETAKKITIKFADNSTIAFTPNNYYTSSNYLYVYYIIITNPTNNLLISYGPDQLYIYRIGSGKPGLDALASKSSSYGEFFPFIPVRVDNKFLSESYHADAFKQATKAYQKSTGGHFEELLTSLKDNDDLDDIDYAYIVFGVSLNVVDMSCKRYLYTFFEKLMFSQIGGPQAYQQYVGRTNAALETFNEWQTWKVQNDLWQYQNTDPHRTSRSGGDGEPGVTDPGPEAPRPNLPQPAKNSIRITGQTSFDTNYDTRLYWTYIINGQGMGKGRSGAKTNDCWIVYMGEDTVVRKYYSNTSVTSRDDNETYDKFRIYWQRSPNLYTYLDVIGMIHKNYIYDGKEVTTGAREALQDDDESGFIVPLHYETWRDTPIIDSSQMGTACVFIVLNSYQVTKKKWYEKGIFRIFLIVIIAIVSVVFTGGAGIGLLGAHLSVGAALGFTGLTAAIVGSVVNALAALVLTTILQRLATMLGVIGPIVSAIIGIVVGGLISSFQAGTGFVFDWTSMFRAENLLKMTQAVGGSVQQVMQGEMLKTQQQMAELGTRAEEEMEKIEQAYVKEFGYGTIDLSGITQIATLENPELLLSESSSTFLARTTLTGADIADMSMDIIHNFADYSLKLPDAFV